MKEVLVGRVGKAAGSAAVTAGLLICSAVAVAQVPAEESAEPAPAETQATPETEAPAQAGTPPGQGGTPPGQGGTPPGQGGTPPGQGGTPPGQDGEPPMPPGQDGNPPPGHAKVTICHQPGTPAQALLTIPPPALNGHLGHGDIVGPCPSETPPTETEELPGTPAGPPDGDTALPGGDVATEGGSGGGEVAVGGESGSGELAVGGESGSGELAADGQSLAGPDGIVGTADDLTQADLASTGSGGDELAYTGLEAPVVALLGLALAGLGIGLRRTAKEPA